MTFPVSCPRAGEVSISADLGPAEAKLSEIIVTRQRNAQASVIKHLEERLTGAAVKCKLTPIVKRIKTPVEEVGFLLKPKRGDKVTVTAPAGAGSAGTFDLDEDEGFYRADKSA